MNYYEHHLGDWAKKCGHLSPIEEGIYRRALDWYYAHERPLPLDLDELARVLRLKDGLELDILQRVLNEFFEPLEDGWHQSRVDRELAKFRNKQPANASVKEAWRIRANQSRERRRDMYFFLQRRGVTAPWNAGTRNLIELLKEHGFTPEDVLNDPKRASVTTPVTKQVTVPVTSHVTVNQAPVTSHQSPEERLLAVTAMRKAGLAEANPQDPRLIALIADGATPEELALVAAEAAAKGKGWAWMLATAKGRREDAKKPQEAFKTARQRAAEASVRAWTPELASKPSEGVL